MGDTGGAADPCGAPGAQEKCLHISAWATRNWIGYTAYDLEWKPRLASISTMPPVMAVQIAH